MSTQMVLKIDPELKEKVSRLARTEGKTLSQVVRELLEEYVRNRDMTGYIDDLWNRIGTKLKDRGVTEEEIFRVIEEVRKGE